MTDTCSSHAMPFGATVQAEGAVRFRLWAPGAGTVTLELDGDTRLPMVREEGWFTLTTDRAGPGSAYRFILADGLAVPDPASRWQPDGVHGPSRVVDPASYVWTAHEWRGRPWHETVLYELHVGTFTPEGTYRAAIGRLDHLVETGVTAVELMPLAQCPGGRNWGYDGVQLFAPHAAYGTPDDLKALIDAAHGRGLMVFLDVVYNHFGPEGNYLGAYAPGFFTGRHETPWGAAINFDGADARPVRDFMIHNALYWLEEYRIDGLRLDAVHAILDDSSPHILEELARRVRTGTGTERHVHLVLENEHNGARLLARDGGEPRFHTAQWNDDYHHAAHVLATGESGGYYGGYAADPVAGLCRALAEGFIDQGDPSPVHGGAPRGEVSRHLPPLAFVNFLQNHDQIGNRAFGERLTVLAPPDRVEALLTITLLAPSIPLLFMGEEWGETTPFAFFTDFAGDLADAVREGRRREFAAFPEFADPERRAQIPDPNAPETFVRSRLDWGTVTQEPSASRLALVRRLLRLRAARIAPLLPGAGGGAVLWRQGAGFSIAWTLAGGAELTLVAHLGDGTVMPLLPPSGEALVGGDVPDRLSGWTARWFLQS